MKYILGVLGFIAVLFLLFILVFNRGNDRPTNNTKKITQLVDYADKNSNVSVTTIGKVVGEEERRAIRITVTPSERRLEILSGYDEQVISSQTYVNTGTAYENFLSALGGQGFIADKETPVKDQRSVCPSGKRYVYDLSENGQHVSNLWGVSCDRTGTFNGKGTTIRQLFEQQIPDYSALVTTTKL